MNVLVTGGAGFIGSHVCEGLIREGHRVSIIDELNDFYSPALKEENLQSIRSIGPVEFFCKDIRDEAAMTFVFEKAQPDLVIHLAARAGIRPSLEQPLLYESVNVRGTMVLLDACQRTGVKDIVFASSSSVYGASNRAPFSEADQVNKPISPYAATKLAGENICYTYSHLYGIRIVCLRFFTVYGPRQRPDLAIRKFAEMIDQGLPIPVYGDGSSSRDYTFIDDIVDGVLAAARYKCSYEIMNLGNSTPVNLLTVIRTLEEALGKTANLRWLPDQPGDVPITCADISKTKRLLGYCPQTPFATGIGRFLEWRQRSGSLVPLR
ncbi:MAG TPA: NAD-dependent epimerase/dehydratase family protein [Bryobacteraceae bacterium]|jgi:UDP-glucuronate 4-epimerase